MNSLRLLIVLLILPLTAFSQLNDQQKQVFKEEFKKISDTFENNLKPYLLKFSEQQYKDDYAKANPILLKTRYDIYVQKAGFLREEGFEIFISQLDSGVLIDRDMVVDYFDMSYRNNFPGLDFIFFEKCKDELKKQKGQK
jgi:hypothetical protein